MNRAVFLDRDGVINRSILVDGVPRPPSKISDVEILEGVTEAVQKLKSEFFVPVVVTNQPDVARGLLSTLQVHEINEFIGSIVGVEFFYTCFHDNEDLCDCRKPLPGLINRASAELNLDTSESYIIGDRWSDISAGQAAGCRAFFIDYSYPEKRPELPFTNVSSLLEAVHIITGDSYGAR